MAKEKAKAKAKTLNNATAEELAEKLLQRLSTLHAIEVLAAALHREAAGATGIYRARRHAMAAMLIGVASTGEQLEKAQ